MAPIQLFLQFLKEVMAGTFPIVPNITQTNTPVSTVVIMAANRASNENIARIKR